MKTYQKVICYIGIVILIGLLLIWLLLPKKETLNVESYNKVHAKLMKIIKNIPRKNRINLPVFYINLNKDIDRNYNIQEQFKKYNIKPIRVSAIYGKLSASTKQGEIYGNKFTNTYNLTHAEIGCTLSHLITIKKAYDEDYHIAIIFEDDISLDLMPLWDTNLNVLLSDINADIIQLSNSSCEFDTAKSSDKHNLNCYGTFAYAIKRNGMKNILDNFYRNGVYTLQPPQNETYNEYDGRADILLYKYAGISKMIVQPLFFTVNNQSTIHTTNWNDILALNHSIESIKYYINKYSINEVSPKMFVPIKEKPVIWQVWPGDDEIPPYMQLCHETVKKFNSSFFTVILVRPTTLRKYVKKLHPSYEYMSYVHKADYLRCVLLHEYGGIYLDMDTICFKSLENYFKKIAENDVVGYDGSRWGELWGVSAMGPYRPHSVFTTMWKNALFKKLDSNFSQLKEYRSNNKSLKKDSLPWSSILRDIVLPLSHELKNKIHYSIDFSDWQSVSDKDILTDIPIPEISSGILILNNALYPEKIKTYSIAEIQSNNNILLFKLLNKALKTKINTIPSILPGIQKIIYINLEHRTDRKKRLLDEFKKIGIHPNQLYHLKAVYTPENGAVGCFKSHIKALQVATDKYKGQNVLICEDDIVFRVNKETLYQWLYNFFNDPIYKIKYNVLMLAHNTQKSEPTYKNNVIRLLESQTSSAYVGNTSYLKKILKLFELSFDIYKNSNNKWLPEYCNDQCWKVLQKHDNWYGFKYAPIIQGKSYSDIEKKVVSYEAYTPYNKNYNSKYYSNSNDCFINLFTFPLIQKLINNPLDIDKNFYYTQCLYNLPINLMFADFLYKKGNNYCFIGRDCYFLYNIYNKLYPNNKSVYFYGSGMAMRKASQSYIEYTRYYIVNNYTWVDLGGTNNTYSKFMNNNFGYIPPKILLVAYEGKIATDNLLYLYTIDDVNCQIEEFNRSPETTIKDVINGKPVYSKMENTENDHIDMFKEDCVACYNHILTAMSQDYIEIEYNYNIMKKLLQNLHM